jgi:glycosyltransferase involved in cell wall biosynthesis
MNTQTKAEGKQRICLNMIVKNEAAIIKRCIDSVYNLIDTWCIVDTGSTDGTQEIIKELLKDKPGVLHERPWVNFGHNRDEALKLARSWGNWSFLTDADMILVDKGFSRSELDLNADVYDLVQDNGGTVYNNMRLLNNRKKWRCVGVTHEYYDCEGGVNNRGVINSLYFNDVADGGSKHDKFERDIKLLTQGLIDEPENSRYMFYLAQSYRDTQNYDKAIEWYTNRVNAGGWEEEQWFAQYMVGWCKKEQNLPFEEVSNAMFKAWMMRPWRSEPMWVLAILAKKLELWWQARELFKIAAFMPFPSNDVLFISKNAYNEHPLDEFSVASYYTGNFAESAISCEKLLNSEAIPPSEKIRIRKNLWFAQKQLGMYDETALNKYIAEKKKTL